MRSAPAWNRSHAIFSLCREYNEVFLFYLDGFTYERVMIEAWFQKGNPLSPMSNKTLSSRKLIPNQTLKSLIIQYLEEKQAKSEKWVEPDLRT